MSPAAPVVERLRARLAPSGLILRGGFPVSREDGVPPLPAGRPAATLILVGNAGPAMWAAFAGSPEACDGRPDPLDRWTRRILEDAAAAFGAVALFPFGGPPYRPFQRWAMRAEPVSPSPLGILIHPDYGLWHAYRGALAFAQPLLLPPKAERPSPCLACADRPCLEACPVGAFTEAGYDVAACVAHLGKPKGAACLALGCRARAACPVGGAYRPSAEQAAFHMRAFLAARRRG